MMALAGRCTTGRAPNDFPLYLSDLWRVKRGSAAFLGRQSALFASVGLRNGHVFLDSSRFRAAVTFVRPTEV